MAVNPFELMKLKERLSVFQQQHSRFGMFLRDVEEHAIAEGSIIEVKVTDPSGKVYVTNIRLTEDDIRTLAMAKELKG